MSKQTCSNVHVPRLIIALVQTRFLPYNCIDFLLLDVMMVLAVIMLWVFNLEVMR